MNLRKTHCNIINDETNSEMYQYKRTVYKQLEEIIIFYRMNDTLYRSLHLETFSGGEVFSQ